MLKCSRYIFSYETPADEVKDFILRSDDLAAKTYGRDKSFSRLNQVLDQARFLGWPLPRFGSDIPEDFTEIPPQGIDHIFENQSKLLVDVAPVTRVMLEDGKYCPVRMICGSTVAGDLVWRCHLLVDRDGTPYIQRHNRQLKVRTKGTRIVCHTDSLPFDEKYMFECFGGEESGIWPVPFLPEFFAERNIAQKFSPEVGVVEVVKLEEAEPVHVFTNDLAPWYRPLQIDRTRALTFDPRDEYYPEEENQPQNTQNQPRSKQFDPGALVEGWDDFDEEEAFEVDEFEEQDHLDHPDSDHYGEEPLDEDTPLINLATPLTQPEEIKLAEYDSVIANSQIASKAEAEDLRKDPEHKERAEGWLVAAVNRMQLLANHTSKIGALLSILEKHAGQQFLIIQPRQKWAAKVVDVLKGRGIEACLHNPQNKSQTSRFYEGALKVLITNQPKEELFIEDIIIISVSTFNLIPWLDWLNPSQVVYTLPTKQLGYGDFNFVPEHPALTIEIETYKGPGLDILKLPTSATAKAKPAPTSETKTTGTKTTRKPKEKKPPKPKFRIKTGKGRPKSAATYEKAVELAKKLEAKGQKCEIYAPEGKEALYITGMPEQLQGELN